MLDATTTATAALRGPTGLTRPVLTLIPGGWRGEEADIEAVAFMDEVAAAMTRIHNAELERDVPSMSVLHEAARIAHKAGLARAEFLNLTDPRGAA